MLYYEEPSQRIPVRECDVVIAGGGTGGVIAAIAASRTGASTILAEAKGYPGGTALHSFFNLHTFFRPYPLQPVCL